MPIHDGIIVFLDSVASAAGADGLAGANRLGGVAAVALHAGREAVVAAVGAFPAR